MKILVLIYLALCLKLGVKRMNDEVLYVHTWNTIPAGDMEFFENPRLQHILILFAPAYLICKIAHCLQRVEHK